MLSEFTEVTGIKIQNILKMIREYKNNFYNNELHNLDKMDELLERYILLNFT